MSGHEDPDDAFRHAGARSGGAAAIARGASLLASVGDTIEVAVNVPSASNDVWLTERYVLRVERAPHGDVLHREARLAALLPSEIGYPRVLATGTADGHAWMLTERIAGENLWEAWPRLDRPQRLAAIAELWHRVTLLHRVPLDEVAPLRLPGPSKYPFDLLDVSRQLDRLVAAGILSGRTSAAAIDAAERGLARLDSVPRGLVHSDAGLTNALCAGGRLVAVLDLEAAAIAPVDLDLEYLLRGLADPLGDPPPLGPHGPPPADSFEGAFETLVATAQPMLRLPGAPERLVAYAVLFDVAVLGGQLDRGWPVRRVRACSRRLAEVLDSGGYLASVVA